MIAVITGASGHVGGALARALLAEGHRVRAMVRGDARSLEGLPVTIARADVCQAGSLTGLLRGADVVFHAAGTISLSRKGWPEIERVNVEGTGNLIEACLSCKARLVHFSTIHALEQEPRDIAVDESRPLLADPHAPPYDRSKAAAQRLVAEAAASGLDAVILNPTGIIGPYDFKPSFLGRFLIALARGSFPMLVDGGFDWVDVRDVARAAARAAAVAPAGARYIISGRWAHVTELARLACRITGARLPRLVAPMALARAAAPVAAALGALRGTKPIFTGVSLAALTSYRLVSRARAEKELDYQPRPLAETLADTYAWFSEHGFLSLPGLHGGASVQGEAEPDEAAR